MAEPEDPRSGGRLEMLRRLGFDELMHDSHVPFLSHLLGTRRVLAAWGSPAHLCDAGLFHSVYGTEYFPTGSDVSREQVRSVIGERAERIVWLWCTIRRDTVDPAALTVVGRHDGQLLDLDQGEVCDLATLWAADTVEQIHRMAPDERDFAEGLVPLLSFASPSARSAAAPLLAAS